MPLRMNMQSGRKHKSKLDVWENQWSGSLAAPLIFCYPLTKYFEMSELCNNSACLCNYTNYKFAHAFVSLQTHGRFV